MLSKLTGAVFKGRGRGGADAVERSAGTDAALVRSDAVVVAAGEMIPGDGRVCEGIALVDESAITGESAPVLRESSTDRSAVVGGTRVVSGRIVVELRRAR